ncbi:unnamed protein product [Sphagnum jensenii]
MGSVVGSIGNLLGGTANGAGFTAQGLNPQQLNTAYNQTNNALSQQQSLANALQSQGQQGMGTQSQLTTALQQQAAGQGPNPALAQLNQATGQNVANQASLMAGQRGASSNVGLMARQAAQQGAATQQQAVGQGATLQAQQQLAAQQQLQNLAATQIGQQSGAVGNLNQYSLQNQGQLLGLQGNMNSTNQAMSAVNANNTASAVGGLVNGIGGLGASLPGMLGGGATAATGTPMAGEALSGATMFAFDGGKVPGKPKVNENSPENDTVPAKLSPGEIVIPLNVLKSEDPVKAAAAFVAKELKKQKTDSDGEENEFKAALKKAIGERKK